MLSCTLFIVFIVSTPAFTYVVAEETNLFTSGEFACKDTSCVSSLVDGERDCLDGSDENSCDGLLKPLNSEDLTLGRSKRLASSCQKNQWQCRDGTCISFDGECDGITDCPDGSDETHALCRKSKCQSYMFRCTYGACVDGTAPCNGIKECADESDELLPRCRNETEAVQGQFRCLSGEMIPASEHCDGVKDCLDGSDETVSACAAMTCSSYLFQCAYGACVDMGSDCNGSQECADGSDEDDELCNRIPSGTPKPPVTVKPVDIPTPPQGGKCVLPHFPEYGTYTMSGNPNPSPGQTFPNVFLNITCNPGFGVERDINSLYCHDGIWSHDIPKCVKFCRLQKDVSVEYHCLVTGANSLSGERECGEQEPDGTVVIAKCRTPNYYYSGELNPMRCANGMWNYIAKCKAECGTVTSDGVQLVLGGTEAERGELPWHAGIYTKQKTPYEQMCGGSLISKTTIISAAHCFWEESSKLQPAANFAVAVGKIHRSYDHPNDTGAQHSDVSDIKISPYFQGQAGHFQSDIALVIAANPFTYETYIRPVCIDFDLNFDRIQLTDNNLGKVAGWGLTSENGVSSEVLKVVELPYINISACIEILPPTFTQSINSDKICAGYTNGTTVCQGDSGGGLAFPATEQSTQRYYLRGIVSTAPIDDNRCNKYSFTTFTQITKHEQFIKQYIL